MTGISWVLEFAIGTGRLALPMLTQLGTKADEGRLPVGVGDRATERVPGQFSLASLVFNAISNLLMQREQVACFGNVARHFGPDGRFVIELWVPVLPHPAGPQAVIGQSVAGCMQFDSCDVVAHQVVSHHFSFGDAKEVRLIRSPHR